MTSEEYWCPRRAEIGGSRTYGPDKLDRNTGCSYCGSTHPDVFMEIARGNEAGELGPTDKSYKVYVTGTPTPGQRKFYFQHLNEEQMREFVDLYNARPRRQYSDEDRSFTQAEGTGMLISYPGYFYASPYFMSPAL
jgi:hypothetical protein